MTRLRFCILTLFSFYSLSLLAQNGPAIINDSDGFTYVRSGPGTKYEIIDTLFNEEFFYFKLEDKSDWAKLLAWKGSQIEGFIHKSRIQEVKNLDSTSLKEVILKVLDRHRVLADNDRAAWKSKDSLAYQTASSDSMNYSDTKYDPILQVIPDYFCSTCDIEVIDKFFATMWADRASVNEMPSFSIGDCFVCNPDLVIKRLEKIMNYEQKILILDQIEWGLLNHFDVDENGNSDDKEFKELIERVNKERKKASP